MHKLFTSESVSEGHPDKVADQISDALLDHFLLEDPHSKVACETLVTTGLVVLSGEVKTNSYIDVQEIARSVIKKIGYTKSEYKFDADSCGVISAIHEQSSDIRQGVDKKEQGAGDQGMMFGYACNETDSYMPVPIDVSHIILQEMADMRREDDAIRYLRPDSKSQVTLEYDENNLPVSVNAIVISTQHDDFDTDENMHKKIYSDLTSILMPRVISKLPSRVQALFHDNITYHINPTGKFVIGGPHGDTGLTGRKIIVDTYGGKGAHGGGAFSGKDSSKVDRSAAYATRHMAKNMVAAGVADQILVQVAYAIGVAKPMGLFVDTYGTAKIDRSDAEIAHMIQEIFDMRPAAIVNELQLKNPMFYESAAYGHMGRKNETVKKSFLVNGNTINKEVELFTWERLNKVEDIRRVFDIQA